MLINATKVKPIELKNLGQQILDRLKVLFSLPNVILWATMGGIWLASIMLFKSVYNQISRLRAQQAFLVKVMVAQIQTEGGDEVRSKGAYLAAVADAVV